MIYHKDTQQIMGAIIIKNIVNKGLRSTRADEWTVLNRANFFLFPDSSETGFLPSAFFNHSLTSIAAGHIGSFFGTNLQV